MQPALGGIDEAVAMAVFRITQEAVTNMLRHAQARNLVIRLQRTPRGWRCQSKTMAAASCPPGNRPKQASGAWPVCRSG